MMKYLLLGASALALSATAANAQSVSQATPDNVSEVSVAKQGATPVTSTERTGLSAAMKSGDLGNTLSIVSAGDVNGAVAGTGGVPTLTAQGNKSVVDQDGTSNTATVDQQGGNRGWAVVKQDGSYNAASVNQDDTTLGSAQATHNAAFVQQIGGSANERQTAVVNQYRDDPNTGNPINSVSVLQGGFGNQAGGSNQARIEQTGTANSVTIAQGVGATSSDQGNYAYVEQLRYNGHNARNSVVIQQREDGNAAVFQRYSAESSASIVQGDNSGGLDSDIVQTGYSNHAHNYQELSTGTADSFINQLGGGNKAFVVQAGSLTDGVSNVFQTGDSNLAIVQQTAAPTAVSHVSQNGAANVSSVLQ